MTNRMTDEEAITILDCERPYGNSGCGATDEEIEEAFNIAIEAIKQEPKKDEIILTKKEYRELLSSEFDNGYAKGYREALEQEPVIDKIRAELIQSIQNGTLKIESGNKELFHILDKYTERNEVKKSEE